MIPGRLDYCFQAGDVLSPALVVRLHFVELIGINGGFPTDAGHTESCYLHGIAEVLEKRDL